MSTFECDLLFPLLDNSNSTNLKFTKTGNEEEATEILSLEDFNNKIKNNKINFSRTWYIKLPMTNPPATFAKYKNLNNVPTGETETITAITLEVNQSQTNNTYQPPKEDNINHQLFYNKESEKYEKPNFDEGQYDEFSNDCQLGQDIRCGGLGNIDQAKAECTKDENCVAFNIFPPEFVPNKNDISKLITKSYSISKANYDNTFTVVLLNNDILTKVKKLKFKYAFYYTGTKNAKIHYSISEMKDQLAKNNQKIYYWENSKIEFKNGKPILNDFEYSNVYFMGIIWPALIENDNDELKLDKNDFLVFPGKLPEDTKNLDFNFSKKEFESNQKLKNYRNENKKYFKTPTENQKIVEISLNKKLKPSIVNEINFGPYCMKYNYDENAAVDLEINGTFQDIDLYKKLFVQNSKCYVKKLNPNKTGTGLVFSKTVHKKENPFSHLKYSDLKNHNVPDTAFLSPMYLRTNTIDKTKFSDVYQKDSFKIKTKKGKQVVECSANEYLKISTKQGRAVLVQVKSSELKDFQFGQNNEYPASYPECTRSNDDKKTLKVATVNGDDYKPNKLYTMQKFDASQKLPQGFCKATFHKAQTGVNWEPENCSQNGQPTQINKYSKSDGNKISFSTITFYPANVYCKGVVQNETGEKDFQQSCLLPNVRENTNDFEDTGIKICRPTRNQNNEIVELQSYSIFRKLNGCTIEKTQLGKSMIWDQSPLQTSGNLLIKDADNICTNPKDESIFKTNPKKLPDSNFAINFPEINDVGKPLIFTLKNNINVQNQKNQEIYWSDITNNLDTCYEKTETEIDTCPSCMFNIDKQRNKNIFEIDVSTKEKNNNILCAKAVDKKYKLENCNDQTKCPGEICIGYTDWKPVGHCIKGKQKFIRTPKMTKSVDGKTTKPCDGPLEKIQECETTENLEIFVLCGVVLLGIFLYIKLV